MHYFQIYQGEFYALFTAIFWTATALAFESASLKVGSLSVNVIRLLIGLLFLSVFTWIQRGHFLPADASKNNWLWLSISGLIGFVFGDLFLFKSYTIIGSRFAMLVMSLVPPLAAFFGWIILGEKLNIISFLAMGITLTGISMAIFSREDKSAKLSLKLAPKGLLFAFGGAIGQALGLVLSKFGMQGYDPFAATQIRIIAGIVGFGILVSFAGRWKSIYQAMFNTRAILHTATGSFFGPFLGVSFSLLAVVHTEAGIASTIMSLVPVFIIAPAILFMKQKVTLLEIAGAAVSVIGVAIFFVFK
jgi:drug/metabolite transporter (DMT)-like permease